MTFPIIMRPRPPATADLITNHTSATSASGTASASDEVSPRAAWCAFNGSVALNATDTWLTNAGFTTGWLKYQFTSGKVVKRYTIVGSATDAGGANAVAPNTWTFEGSNDGSSWTTLDSQTGQTSWSVGLLRSYDITNKVRYLYYRLNVSANNGDPNRLGLAELRLLGY